MPPNHRLISRHRWLSLYAGYCDEPFVATNAGVYIVPLTVSGEILFIREPSIPTGEPHLTLPGGSIDPGETPAVSANRELQEEAGYRAAKIDYLGTLNPLSKFAQWDIAYFLARDLTKSQLVGDEEYPITVERHPLVDLEALIASGQLTSSSVVAGLYMARSFLAKEAQQAHLWSIFR